MAVDGGQETGITLSNQDLAVNKEPDISEVQRQILEKSQQILQGPRVATLTYPNENGYLVAAQGYDPDYEHGSQVRFAMLKKPGLSFGRDEVCVALVNNISDEHPVTLGAGLIQHMQGKKSDHEIAVMRFVQTPHQRLRGGGTVTKVIMSDTDPTFTGTFSKKGEAYPYRVKSDIPTFSEHWESGNAQLADQIMYDAPTTDKDFTNQDYKDILNALNNYKIDTGLTSKVVKSEDRVKLAKTGKEPVNITPKPKALSAAALK